MTEDIKAAQDDGDVVVTLPDPGADDQAAKTEGAASEAAADEQREGAAQATPDGRDRPRRGGAEERISELTRKYREEQRAREEERRQKEELANFTRALLRQSAASQAGAYAATLDAKIQDATGRYSKALGEGDTEAIAKITNELGNLNAQRVYIENVARQAQTPAQGQAPQQPAQSAPSAPQPQQRPQVSGPIRDFIKRNESWWAKDAVMTAAARAIDQQLYAEGVHDPDTNEYAEELERRVKAAFPHQFDGAEAPSRTRATSPVAGVSRASGGGRRQVQLNARQVAIAHALGLTEQQYAEEWARLNPQSR